MAIRARRHWIAIIVGLSVGLIYASHHFFVPYFLPVDTVYHPLTAASYLDEATFYGLRAHAVFEGAWRAGDISLAEYRNSPALLSMFNPLVLGGLSRIVGSFERGIIFSDFLFPTVIFFLLYAIGCELTNRKKISMLCALFFLFAPKIAMYIPPVSGFHAQELFSAIVPFFSVDSPLYFSSFEEPKLTFPFLALCVLLVLYAMRKNTRIFYLLAGVSFGLLFYTYLYDWASMLVGLCVFAVLLRIYGHDAARSRGVVMIMGVGLAVSSFYWINMLQLASLSQASELVARIGREVSYILRFTTVWKTYARALMLIGGLLMVMRGRAKEERAQILFLISLLSAYFFTVNAQVITGFNVQPDHWYRTQFLIVALVWLMFAAHFLPYLARGRYGIFAQWIAIPFFVGYFLAAHAYVQYDYSKQSAYKFIIPAPREEAFAWLNSRTAAGSVVATLSADTNRELLLYTHNRIFIPNGLNTIASEQEIWNRVYAASALFALSPSAFERLIRGNDYAYYLFSERFTDHSFDAAFGPHWTRAFPGEVIDTQTDAYASYAANGKEIPHYRLDYLLLDDRAKAFGAGESSLAKHFEKVYDNGTISLYRDTYENIP